MKKVIFHPFVFIVYPVLALIATNISEIAFKDTTRSFYAACAIGILFFGLIQIIVRDWHKSASITSFGLFLFYTYGHVYSLIQGYSLGPILIGRTLVLAPLWGLILAGWAWFVIRKLQNPKELTGIFNFVALVLILFPLYRISSYVILTEKARQSFTPEIPPNLAEEFEESPPDVYYIILDMHLRADVLEAIYGYDLSWFINALEDRGFYIADESTSNYASTRPSLASSLNMEYINYIREQYTTLDEIKTALTSVLAENKVFQIFRQYGYQTVGFTTGIGFTEMNQADIFIKPTADQIKLVQDKWSLNSFEGILVETTLAKLLFDLNLVRDETFPRKTIETPYKLHRLNILNIISHLPEFARGNEPHFVFAHIIAPHPPIVFGLNGEEIAHTEPFTLGGGDIQRGDHGMQPFIAQLDYLDRLILETIDEILDTSETPPIIIIQADHGYDPHSNTEKIEEGNMKEQYSILNAYLFPDEDYALLYPGITPVNSFRVLFNTSFGGEYEILPDYSYIAPFESPDEFIDVTTRTHTEALIP